MRTYLECIPCFFKQAIEMGRLVTGDENIHKEIINEVAKVIPEISIGFTPPEMARVIHRVIENKLGERDFYREVKQRSNERALALYPKLKEKVENSTDRLLTAVEIAIAGNVIDYGAKNSLNIELEIEKLFSEEFTHIGRTIFDDKGFKAALAEARSILYLADNAGEVVFDRVLIEEIPQEKEILYAVRGKPVINDATVEDAHICGINSGAKIISSGVDAPGTILKYCSDDFKRIYKQADLIISKGQGNYEALSEQRENIYFLFRAKCPVIARHANVTVGDIVLKKRGQNR